LNMAGCCHLNMGDAALVALSRSKSLAALDISACMQDVLTDAGIAALAYTPSLTQLAMASLRQPTVTNRAFEALASGAGERLRVLDVRHCRLTTEACTAIATMRALQRLDIRGARKLSAEGLSALSLCPALHTLALSANAAFATEDSTLRDLNTIAISDAAIPALFCEKNAENEGELRAQSAVVPLAAAKRSVRNAPLRCLIVSDTADDDGVSVQLSQHTLDALVAPSCSLRALLFDTAYAAYARLLSLELSAVLRRNERLIVKRVQRPADIAEQLW
jgi:hypothetical protein